MTSKPVTDKPYAGRRGGRYVRASRDQEARLVDQDSAANSRDREGEETPADAAGADAALPDKGATETADKPSRKRK